MSDAAEEITAFMARRFGRDCLLVPSGRLALYLALRCLLKPGDRVLMSGVNDDVIFFVVLAAGLRPVIAPLCPDDGNIDVEAVSEDTWPGLSAVLTTNLYGLPDRIHQLRARCDRHGLVLIEDGAHAIQTEVGGAPVGTFGDAAALSLSKHADARAGGVLLLQRDGLGPDASTASRPAPPAPAGGPELQRLRDALTLPRSARQRIGDVAGQRIRNALDTLGFRGAARRVRRLVGATERTGYRMPLRAALLGHALAAGGEGLDLCDSWIRVDRHDYRTELTTAHLDRIASRLGELQAERALRVEGVRLLRELDAVAPGVRRDPSQPLFRVPLLIADRDAVRAQLERQGIATHYIYDPPLDDYAGPDFADPSPRPRPARWWARHVLPVDPLRADEVLAALQRCDPPVRPAAVLTSR